MPVRPVSAVPAVVLMIMLAGCGAPGDGPGPTPSVTGSSPSTPAASASIPADGVSLKELGFENGPTDRLSLPRGLSLATAADQPNAVTLVISRPAAAELADYLRRTLPQAGFTIDSDLGDGATITFTGFGWSGSFTGAGSSSALVLRPS